LPNQPTSSRSSVLLEGEVVRHEVVAPVVVDVALDRGPTVVTLDVAKPVVVLDPMLAVELGVLLEALDTKVEEAEVEEVEEVGPVEVFVVDTK